MFPCFVVVPVVGVAVGKDIRDFGYIPALVGGVEVSVVECAVVVEEGVVEICGEVFGYTGIFLLCEVVDNVVSGLLWSSEPSV